MKKLVELSLLAILLVGCVSKSDYNQLLEEIIELKIQIDELENDEERLVNLAKKTYEERKYYIADFYIKQLKEKYPESTEIAYFRGIQPILDSLMEKTLFQDSINSLDIEKSGYYVSDFGERTEKKSIIIVELYGTFSNSATTNSGLKIQFIIDENDIRIQLYEYAGNHPVKGKGKIKFKIKDKNNKNHEILTYSDKEGYIEVYDVEKLKEILLLGGKIQFTGQTTGHHTLNTYSFIIEDANCFKNVIAKMESNGKK